MPITYRTLTEADWDAWVAGNARAFLHSLEDATAMSEKARPLLEFDRGLGAFDGEEMVGGTFAITFTMSVPGGDLPTAGVTGVAVSPTHRRRGVLTELMRRQLGDIHERGEPLAALWASESLIYGRFGYGLAVQSDRVRIDRRHTAFRADAPAPTAEVRFTDPEAALERWPALYERLRGERAGLLARSAANWRRFIIPAEEKPEGGFSNHQYVEAATPAGAEGYAIYDLKSAWPQGLPRGIVRLHELVALTPAAEAALWRYLFGIDLVETIEANNRPPDDPLLWMLEDPRHLQRSPRDTLWLRLLDVPRALAGRATLAEGRLVLEVHDAFGPWAAGRFELRAEGGAIDCRPTTATPDLVLGAGDLAALYFGAVAPTVLARAGRIEGDPEALRLAGALFAWPTAPWCFDEF